VNFTFGALQPPVVPQAPLAAPQQAPVLVVAHRGQAVERVVPAEPDLLDRARLLLGPALRYIW
jgi:hypothetical protein